MTPQKSEEIPTTTVKPLQGLLVVALEQAAGFVALGGEGGEGDADGGG